MTLDVRMDAVLRAIHLVEHQLCAPVTVKDMAAEAGYSPYYFCALFSQWAGHSPYDYLIRRRMTEAGKQLLLTDQRILDTAMDFQFESHEGFTRAYRRMFGQPPRDSQQSGCLPYLACLEPLDRAHLECLWQVGRFIPREIIDWRNVTGVPYTVQICFPGTAVPIPQEEPSTAAVFPIPECSDHALALDWILHTWLFYSPYHLHGTDVVWVDEHTLAVPIGPKA
ncbi:MAG: AraC family transcriptional regulator [Anaerolineae bacterium]|jgi:AraC-like DNA-binding protein|nr:AraC family transcriptional regulator [Anaerolineae bacterium]